MTRLQIGVIQAALDNESPALRALDCRCARFCPRSTTRLIELLEDPAVITLGYRGQREAKARLMVWLETAPRRR